MGQPWLIVSHSWGEKCRQRYVEKKGFPAVVTSEAFDTMFAANLSNHAQQLKDKIAQRKASAQDHDSRVIP